MSSVLYTTMTWREVKVISAARKILQEHHYAMASDELGAVLSSQSLPAHKETRGDGSTVRTRPVKTVELPPMLELPAPKALVECELRDGSRL